MRALTVRQPYAWAIMHGGKDVENRSRNIAGSYRGDIAITAALDDAEDAAKFDWWPLLRKSDEDIRGAVLGVVHLADVHHAAWNPVMRPGLCYRLEDADHPYGQYIEKCSPWADPESWHLELGSPRPLPTPIPVRGRLGLWTLPDDVAAQVEEALR